MAVQSWTLCLLLMTGAVHTVRSLREEDESSFGDINHAPWHQLEDQELASHQNPLAVIESGEKFQVQNNEKTNFPLMEKILAILGQGLRQTRNTHQHQRLKREAYNEYGDDQLEGDDSIRDFEDEFNTLDPIPYSFANDYMNDYEDSDSFPGEKDVGMHKHDQPRYQYEEREEEEEKEEEEEEEDQNEKDFAVEIQNSKPADPARVENLPFETNEGSTTSLDGVE